MAIIKQKSYKIDVERHVLEQRFHYYLIFSCSKESYDHRLIQMSFIFNWMLWNYYYVCVMYVCNTRVEDFQRFCMVTHTHTIHSKNLQYKNVHALLQVLALIYSLICCLSLLGAPFSFIHKGNEMLSYKKKIFTLNCHSAHIKRRRK